MRYAFTLLFAIVLTTFASCRERTVAWDANPASDGVTEYRLYAGTDGNYTLVQTIAGGDTVEVTVDLPDEATHIVLTAANAAGLESLPSDSVAIGRRPEKVRNLKIVPGTKVVIKIDNSR